MSSHQALQTMSMTLPIGNLEAYMCQVNQIPMLTAEEERAYAENFRNDNDIESARRLVLAHLRYVVRVAKGYKGYGLSLGDLIQEGNVGLMKAVKRFDPTVGVRLVSFAVHWIKAEIHEFVLRNWRIVKVATTKAQRKLFFNLRGLKKRFGWFTQAEVNTVARDLNVSTTEVLRMEERLNAMDSPYDLLDTDDDNKGYTNSAASYFLESENSDPALLVEQSDASTNSKAALIVAMESLDERSRDIVTTRWLSDKKATLHELAGKYQISAERIRQLEQNAMQKLKKRIKV